MAVHFVGFKSEEYISAVRVWGLPDMIHRVYDRRVIAEMADDDIVVFARGSEDKYSQYVFDDSARM